MPTQPSEKYSFADKWSERIESFGYTAIPNLLIELQGRLELTTTEFTIICHLLYYRWSSSSPFPAASSLAKHIGLSISTVRSNIRSLESKGIIKRRMRSGDTSQYDFHPLKLRLEECSAGTRPSSSKQLRGYPRTARGPYQQTDTKEDPGNKDPKRKTINNTGFTNIEDLMKARYGSLREKNDRISNDFGN